MLGAKAMQAELAENSARAIGFALTASVVGIAALLRGPVCRGLHGGCETQRAKAYRHFFSSWGGGRHRFLHRMGALCWDRDDRSRGICGSEVFTCMAMGSPSRLRPEPNSAHSARHQPVV